MSIIGGDVPARADPGPGDKIVVAATDIGALGPERAPRRGHHMLTQLRTGSHPVYRRTLLSEKKEATLIPQKIAPPSA